MARQLIYTQPLDILSPAQREFYEHNGYLVLRDLVDGPALDKYENRFNQIVNGEVARHQMTLMKDISHLNKETNTYSINKLQDFQHDPVLAEYLCHPAILKYVECITGPNIVCMHSMLINKPPDPGTKSSRHPLHQDLHYFPFRPANRIVASWTAMQHITRDNGCLVVAPGSHLENNLFPHSYPDWKDGVNKMYHGIPLDIAERFFDKLMYLEMNKGDTVFFHPLLVHGSGSNRSAGFRKAISGHYASSDCYYIDIEGTVQEPLQNEVKVIANKRVPGLVDFTLCDVWRTKKLLVRGKEANI